MTVSRRGRRGRMASRIACPRSFRTPAVPGAAAWPRRSGTFLKGRQTRWSAASSRGRAWEPGFKRRLRVLGNPGRKGGLGRPLGQQERARERSRWPPRRVRAGSWHGARRAPTPALTALAGRSALGRPAPLDSGGGSVRSRAPALAQEECRTPFSAPKNEIAQRSQACARNDPVPAGAEGARSWRLPGVAGWCPEP